VSKAGTIDDAVEADKLCHLSDIATKMGIRLKWDTQKNSFVNNETANNFLTRAMRSPWFI
jgi:hypothetical protein